MRIAVAGLWHLGSVTAACLASGGHEVIGYDSDSFVIEKLKKNEAPIFEPGLNELIAEGQHSAKLQFSSNPQDVAQADILWITFDTPVDDQDNADIEWVMNAVTALFPYIKENTLILISSQLPVGTIRRLKEFSDALCASKNIRFACSPENLRLGKAIDVFTKPDRVIVGLQHDQDKERIQTVLKPFTENIIWMSIESAEMTKHALNAFLATSVVFINEIAALCEQVGANAREVEQGLKSEERIGPKAYLRPGNAIAGGTLARDVNYLIQTGKQHHLDTPFFSALLTSNQAHKQWSCRRMMSILKEFKNKTIATLGLTYKAGTDTLRRSSAIEMCQWLADQGADVLAYDPAVKALPSEYISFIQLKNTLAETLQNADAVVVATEWPEFNRLSVEELLNSIKQPYVFDAGGFLAKNLGNDDRIKYFSVGR